MAELAKFFVEIGSKFDAKGFAKARQSINKVGTAAIVLGAGLAAAGLKAAQVAGVQEQAEIELAAAMKQAGTFTEEAMRANLAHASSLQRLSVFGDEAILSVQKMLTNFGLEGEELKGLTTATLDLAAAKGMDLKAAADLVAKSVGSSTNALTRYGIEVKGAVGSTERAQTAVENITKLFGGAAKAQTESYLGKIKQLQNRWGDVVETIGRLVIPILIDLVNFINANILPALEDFTNDLENTGKGTKVLRNILKVLMNTLVGVKSAFDIAGQSAAIFALIASGNLKAAKMGVEELKQKVMEYGNTFDRINRETVETTQDTEQEKSNIRKTFDAITIEDMNNTNNIIKDGAESTKEKIQEVYDTLGLAIKSRQEEMKKMEEAWISFQTGLANSFSSTLSQMMQGQKSFGEGMKQIWKDIANFVIAEIARMIAKMLVFKALSGFTPFGIGGLFSFATGGVVPGPKGAPRMAVVHGGEEVLTPSQRSSGVGTLIVNIPPMSTRQEARRMGAIAGEEILRQVNNNLIK